MAATPSPFHAGEKRVQERLGVADEIEAFARKVVRDHLPDQHRDFYRQLPFLIVGTVDDRGMPWASLVPGDPGFIGSPDERTLGVAALPLPGDPLNETLRAGAEIGVLGIQLETRRRNRLTGRIARKDDGGFTIAVGQTFGNCPQYIQTRAVQYRPPLGVVGKNAAISRADQIDARAQDMIAKADTLFIATAYADSTSDWANGADVSHRGGKPGFVRIEDEQSFVFPDFYGNNHFNTVGNIELNPKAGFLFPDFATGDLLFVSGDAEIVWEGPEVTAFKGAQRLIRCRARSVIHVENVLPLTFAFGEFSPLLDHVGSWEDAAAALAADKERNSYIAYDVFDVQRESDVIASYYLRRADGKALFAHDPGQFLPIRLNIPGDDDPLIRTYTISDTSNGEYFRLSVKREGGDARASNYFHDCITAGSRIAAMAPRGKFVLDRTSERPVVLLSAGVGVTPMIAMANAIMAEGRKTKNFRQVYFLHGTQNGRSHAFAEHVRTLAAEQEGFVAHICYSRPGEDDELGITHDFEGRIDIELLKNTLPFDDYDFYLCGPEGFMRSLFEGLTGLGVRPERIHYESFGPATIFGPSGKPGGQVHQTTPQSEPVPVRFSRSDVEIMWTADKGTLLELAEAAGIDAPFSCRSGVCGTCATRLQCGTVDYIEDPANLHADDEVLICCSTPRAAIGNETCGGKTGLELEL
ncbi:MAG: pyridoxamine 5'-phosphate oxidase family protein [Pseudomonadota bacterium]